MKIFEIDRTFPKHDKKQFKSVEELLEFFKVTYGVEWEFVSENESVDGLFEHKYNITITESGAEIQYGLLVMFTKDWVMSWGMGVILSIGIWYSPKFLREVFNDPQIKE